MHAMSRFWPPQGLFYGETLACYPRAVYFLDFSGQRHAGWTSVFLWLWLGHRSMESKSLAMPTTIFALVEPMREFAPLSQKLSHMWQG
jgi:hypothetical protein